MAKCVLEKFEIVDSDGKIVKEKLAEIISDWPEEMQSTTIKCGEDLETITSCQTMEEYRKCIQPAVEKLRGAN